jgi:hypothetical protein
MDLGFAIIGPEICKHAFFFKFLDLCGFVSQVKDAPLFSRRVVADVRSDLQVRP